MSSEISSLYAQLRSSLLQAGGRPRFNDATQVLVYGTGSVAKDVCRLLTRRGVVVLGFLDHAAQPGATWQGIPIHQPDSPALSPSLRRQVNVVMGVFNAYVEMPPIARLLTELGYGHVTSFLDLHDRFPAELGERFWLTRRDYYLDTEALNEAVYALWSDEQSRALHASLLRCRFTKDLAALPPPDRGTQYFDPPGMPPWSQPLRLVDCGAYDGDTVRQLSELGIATESLAAFEPDPENFAKLSRCVTSQQCATPGDVYLFPCGVGASTEQLRFSKGHAAGSHIDPDGSYLVQCVALDDVLPRFAPNLIKMDIEGAELAALWGARRTIAAHRPGLAICVYHRPEHLWQIPSLVKGWYGDGSQYYLRAHWYNGFDVVLYVHPL